LVLPEERVLQSSNPVEPLALTTFVHVDAYRPRIVVYADVNENGRFEPDILGGAGPDAILGADDERASLPTAILDLDGALRRLTLADTQSFYEHTGGAYSAFVWTEPVGAGLVLSERKDLYLTLPESDLPERDLDCTRSLSRSQTSLPLGLAFPPTHALVDAALDPKVVCGTTIVDCESTDFAALVPPSFEEDDTGDEQRLIQCRSNDSFEFLSILDRSVECDACLCRTVTHVDLYVTTPSAPPAWWPCGTSVPYCDSAAPATAFDFSCRLKSRDAGADASRPDGSAGDGSADATATP
jgi:hypothetical protein